MFGKIEECKQHQVSASNLTTAFDQSTSLPGPPLTKNNAAATLISHGVTVGIGIEEIWSARNLRFDMAWQAIESGLSKETVFAMASTNLEKLLGVRVDHHHRDLVATQGGDLFDMKARVVAVLSPNRETTHFF
jgi:hypothetical protein